MTALRKPLLYLKLACLACVPSMVVAATVPALINYQGRLTDAAAVPLAAGQYSVAFRLWDTQSLNATQRLIWAREYDVIIVENGAFNVLLGASGRAVADQPPPVAADITSAFDEPNRYLGLTITRGTNGQPVPNPTELVPRQQILSTPYAFHAQGVFADGVSTTSLRDLAVTSSKLAVATVGTAALQNRAVTLEKLAPRPVGTNVPAGGLALSGSSADYSTTAENTDVTNLVVTIVTSGRPVFVGLIGDGSANDSFIGSNNNVSGTTGRIGFLRNTNLVYQCGISINAGGAAGTTHRIPPTSFFHLDMAPPGTNTYRLRVVNSTSRTWVQYTRLVAYEF